MAVGIHMAMLGVVPGVPQVKSPRYDGGDTMTPLIGRLLQLSGMIVLPIGLMYGLGRGDIRTEVKLLALGGFLFVLGWILSREKSA